MKVNSNRDISFKSLYTNSAFKRTLEFASVKPALFSASATVGFSLLRPLSILSTPNADRENRELACAKSITSSLLNFGIMLGVSHPIDKAIKKIDDYPEKFIKKESLNFYKNGLKDINGSKRYVFASQFFKLGIMSAVAIPKAIMTAASIPYIIRMFEYSKSNKNVYKQEQNTGDKPNFRGRDGLAPAVGKIFDKKGMKNLSDKYKDSNFIMHIMALTDTLSTLTFIQQTQKSKKIKEERKNALIYNSAISTGLCIGCGYIMDKLLNKPAEKFIENFKKANKNEKNIEKQVQGIKIMKPLLILGTIYYILIPLVSTYLAEIADKNGGFRVNKIDK